MDADKEAKIRDYINQKNCGPEEIALMMGLSEKVVADYVNVIKNSEKQPIEGSLEYAGATDESYK